ncbi:NUDIX domain-containing protein [Peribacillus frigoritolerans]|uniref:NUDIX domain-containing protein n=1 Tax=Peribacillus frigoritolerans TaxID=450367 RepID=UPI00105929D9|nr:NUDIX hydrolase [Peribacillus frigoritolerans]TDL80542.1 NUDIX hydrolase [Peribacillus frigoritolerans]
MILFTEFREEKTIRSGSEFVDFLMADESELDSFQPLAGSFVILNCRGKLLLCFSTKRKRWELPGGRRKSGESSKECAIRELFEETGQFIPQLEFAGLLKKRKKRTGKIKYSPIFFADAEELMPFKVNKETSKIILWDLSEHIGIIDQKDFSLLIYLKERLLDGNRTQNKSFKREKYSIKDEEHEQTPGTK